MTVSQREAVSAGAYDDHIQRDVMVPMRDGVQLATDLHRPAQGGQPLDGPFPVLLLRTPYNKSTEARALEARFFVSHGYVAVIQDCRGRYASEGGFTKYVAEGPDGCDTLEWLVRQSWCNGKIGTHGLSYSAHTQAAMASLGPPNLSCMWLDSGGFFNAFQTGCRNGGAFELRQVTWAFREALESPDSHLHPMVTRAAMKNQDIHDWFQRLPWKKGHSPLQWTPDYEDYLLDIWSRETFDDYWRQAGLCAQEFHSKFAHIPQVHMSSWYDPYAASTTNNFAALSQAGRGPVNLIMGPWTHGARSVTHSGDIDLGAQSILDNNLDTDYNHLRLRFFDRWLKGIANSWEDESPVKVFVMGGGSGRRNSQRRLDHGGQWREENEWPLARANNTAFYLKAGGGLSAGLPEGGQPPSDYLFDPNQPVPTIGGNISSGQPIMEAGGFDQRESDHFYGCRPPYLPLAARPDVLVFQTEPLEEDMEVTGPISVRLWIDSSAADTDFTAKLLDVYPPSQDYPEGYALNLTDGIFRCKFRNSWEEPELMEPGEVYAVTIELMPTSNLFLAGHRIRLDVSSSNFPRFDVNGNTGENPGRSPVKVSAKNQVYHDAERPSHVMLPIIPVVG
ncbi:MAG: CocE/NonD family hydrolase [Chloroflexi bacterium]|nr:CocE/NonD family hydrolase [Chloroflexota bacterium]